MSSKSNINIVDECPKSCVKIIDAAVQSHATHSNRRILNLEQKIERGLESPVKKSPVKKSPVKKSPVKTKKKKVGPPYTQWAKDNTSLIKGDSDYKNLGYIKTLHKLWKKQPESVQNKYKNAKTTSHVSKKHPKHVKTPRNIPNKKNHDISR